MAIVSVQKLNYIEIVTVFGTSVNLVTSQSDSMALSNKVGKPKASNNVVFYLEMVHIL